jgi:hypothetical protein
MLLQLHIAEADKAKVGAKMLIPANIVVMTRILPLAEGKRWRDQPGRIHPLDIDNGFSTLVDRRLQYRTTHVANCERLVLPKPTPMKGPCEQVTISRSTQEQGHLRRLGEPREFCRMRCARDDHEGGQEAGRRQKSTLPAPQETRSGGDMEIPLLSREGVHGETFLC